MSTQSSRILYRMRTDPVVDGLREGLGDVITARMGIERCAIRGAAYGFAKETVACIRSVSNRGSRLA